MTDIYDSKKIKWFEEFTYQLIKNVNHVSFHKERESRLKRYESVNLALVNIFAYRLTYENFGMLNDRITQVAAEIASEKFRDMLTQLETSADKATLKSHGSDASHLIEIILLLLHEEIDKYLKQDMALEMYLDEDTELAPGENEPEKEDAVDGPSPLSQEDKQDRASEIYTDEKIGSDEKKEIPHARWTTSASEDRLAFRGELLDDLAKHLAEYEQRKAVLSAAKLKEQDPEDFPGDKKTPEEENSEAAVPLEKVESEVDKSLDMLAMNLGDEGLDELIFGKASQKEKDANDDEDQWMGWVD